MLQCEPPAATACWSCWSGAIGMEGAGSREAWGSGVGRRCRLGTAVAGAGVAAGAGMRTRVCPDVLALVLP
jgi:hypothetical protein